MKLYLPSPLHVRRPFCSLISASFLTETGKPPPPILPPPAQPHLTYLQSVLNQIKVLSENPRNHYSLTILDSLLAQTHLLDSAISLILIDYLSQIKKLERCKTVISHLQSRGRVRDPFLYSLVFDFIVKDGKIGDVENVWAEICGSVKSFDFSNYVTLVCKFGGIDEVKDVCERILMDDGSVLKRQSYVALVGALCKLNEGVLAKEIVEKMYDKGFKVDHWTHFFMFQCFCRNGDLKEADLVLRKLVINGFTIDISIYGNFLYGLCKSGKFREANKLFRKLIKQGLFRERSGVLREGRRAIFQLNSEGLVPEAMAYETYCRALCNVGKLDEAEVLLKKMMRSRIVPEICVYGSFIKALFRANRDEDAMKFFEVQRKKRFIRVDEIGRYVVFGLCEKGKVDEALRLFEEIAMVKGFANDLSICNSILDSYLKEGRVADAERLFERFHEGSHGRPNVLSYTIMFNGYCNDGDVSKAVMVFEEMLTSKMAVNGAVYERLIRELCDCGRRNEAFNYLNDMIENGHLIFCKRWRILLKSIFSLDEHDIFIGSKL